MNNPLIAHVGMSIHSHPSQESHHSRQARTVLPEDVHTRLKELAASEHTTIEELLRQGAILVCRFHHRGDGLPKPIPSRRKKGGSK